jgi:hypothetical protein
MEYEAKTLWIGDGVCLVELISCKHPVLSVNENDGEAWIKLDRQRLTVMLRRFVTFRIKHN